MSPSRFFKIPEVVAKFKPLRPKLSRQISAPLKVPPRTANYMLVGTAFDYLLRFELQRRAPHAISESLVAEFAAKRIWQPGFFVFLSPEDKEAAHKAAATHSRILLENPNITGVEYLKKLKEAGPSVQAELAADSVRFAKAEEAAKKEADRVSNVVNKAKTAIATYVRMKRPDHTVVASLAAHAIRLAKLDEMSRVGQLNPSFEETDSDDVE